MKQQSRNTEWWLCDGCDGRGGDGVAAVMFMVLASNQKLTNYDPRRIPLLTRTAERSVGSAQSKSATGSPNLDLSNPEYQKDPLASRLSSVTKILSSVHKSVVCGQFVWQKRKAEELEEQEAGLELAGCIGALF